MKIYVNLVGILQDRSPPEEGIVCEDGATIQDILAVLRLTATDVHACTVNGMLVRDRDFILNDGDQLTVVPPVVGG